jgi:hypothetical protein
MISLAAGGRGVPSESGVRVDAVFRAILGCVLGTRVGVMGCVLVCVFGLCPGLCGEAPVFFPRGVYWSPFLVPWSVSCL